MRRRICQQADDTRGDRPQLGPLRCDRGENTATQRSTHSERVIADTTSPRFRVAARFGAQSHLTLRFDVRVSGQ